VLLDDFRATVARLTGSTVLVSVSGELDLHTSERFQQVIAEATAVGAETVLVDLSGVGFVDSTALGVIVQETKRLEGRGHSLLLVTNDPRTLRVLEVTGLDRALRRHATLHDALSERTNVEGAVAAAAAH
jgi:anti-sigma B factor antagonist